MSKELYISSTPHETKVAIVEDDQLAEIIFERENEYTLAGSIYKGRVTRVLPGMQSAFVDIGLERDAFLYVTDFLEENEDQEEFENVIGKPQEGGGERKQGSEGGGERRGRGDGRARRDGRGRDRNEGGERGPRPWEKAATPIPPEPIARAAEYVLEGGNGAPENPVIEEEQGEEPGEQQGAGSRRWRGRRRRRGRGGRGMPESKFVQAEGSAPAEEGENGDAADDFAEPAEIVAPPAPIAPPSSSSSSGRMLLPGESLAKYSRGSQDDAQEHFTHDVQPFAPAQAEVPDEASAPLAMADEAGLVEPPVQPRGQSFVAGSEHPVEDAPRPSESRYARPGRDRDRDRGRDRDRNRGGRERDRDREPRAERDHRSEPSYPPIVLPGESIAKYRGVAPAENPPARAEVPAPAEAEARKEEETHIAPVFLANIGEHAETHEPAQIHEEVARPVEPAPSFQPEPPAAPPAEAVPEKRGFWRERRARFFPEKPAAPPVAPEPFDSSIAAPVVPAPSAEPPTAGFGQPPSATSDRLQSVDAPERRDDAIPSAAPYEVTGGYFQEEEEISASSELAQAGSAGTAQELERDAPGQPRAHAFEPGHGVLEEEEILEEEETEYNNFDEPEHGEFEELEEEERIPGSGEETIDITDLGDAVQDEYLDRTATGEFESEGLNGDDDADGEDDEEDEDEEDLEPAEMQAGEVDPEHPDYQGRAELRGAPGTAGFQRPERPGERRRGDKLQRGRRGSGRRMGRGRNNVQRESQPTIAELLKEGQEILVQIAKEPIAKKGARITSHIALPGRFLVYMPTVNHFGVSRKIASEEERQRLKRILTSERGEAHGGFIVRTAASGASEDDLRADIRFLINLWTEIKQRAEKGKAPALIYHDLNVVERTLRDQVTSNFSQIWVDSEQEYERILRFMSRFQPQMVRRVKLYTKDTPLFEQFNVQEELNKALKSKVWLKSGGYIVINQTEALVAIDINTGKFVGKTARLEDTIVKTNIDAIQEIVRQVRLRDLGGIIIIDFIDMDERKNRARVMQALEEALKQDRAPSKVLQFNDFGLVAITRKRVKQSLERTLGITCNYCVGTGIVKSPVTIANEIWVEMKKMARQLEARRDVVLRAHPEVIKSLKADGGKRLLELEDLTQRTVILKADPVLHQEQFDIN